MSHKCCATPQPCPPDSKACRSATCARPSAAAAKCSAFCRLLHRATREVHVSQTHFPIPCACCGYPYLKTVHQNAGQHRECHAKETLASHKHTVPSPAQSNQNHSLVGPTRTHVRATPCEQWDAIWSPTSVQSGCAALHGSAPVGNDDVSASMCCSKDQSPASAAGPYDHNRLALERGLNLRGCAGWRLCCAVGRCLPA